MDDIHSYLDANSSKSTYADVCSIGIEPDSDTDHLQPKNSALLLYSIVLNLTHGQANEVTIRNGRLLNRFRV